MSHPQSIDLSFYEKKIRSKLRLAIFMGKILHFMYLAVKNYPREVKKYNNTEELIKDQDFARKVFLKEAREETEEEKQCHQLMNFLKSIVKRGFTELLEPLNVIWKMTISSDQEKPKLFISDIMGASLWDMPKIIGNVIVRPSPLMLIIRQFSIFVLEAEFGLYSDQLAKTSVYIGQLQDADLRLSLAVRFSLNTGDAEALVNAQERGYKHVLVKDFRVYPSLLRMLRTPYKKMKAERGFEEELKSIISEVYVSENNVGALVNMDVEANILAMISAVSLSGGLCFPVAFEGELLSPLDRKASIKVGDIKLKAYPTFCSVLQLLRSPGHYVFLGFMPITIPRVVLIAGNWRPNSLEPLRPRVRGVLKLNSLFPRLDEVLSKARIEELS